MTQLIFTFISYYKNTLWGGDMIGPYKGEDLPDRHIGESWEISAVDGKESTVASGPDRGLTLGRLCEIYGEELLGHECVRRFGLSFPLLVKIIDARYDLSVQVHPDDALAARRNAGRGKTEMWYVLRSRPGAMIYCGLRKNLSPDSLAEVVEQGRLRDYLAAYHPEPGDSFFIPAGTVHSIGAGNMVVEIQQSSDVTYRIDDFGRRDADGNLRELHLDLARDAINYSTEECNYIPAIHSAEGEFRSLVKCRYFTTSRLTLGKGQIRKASAPGSFMTVVCTEGEVTLSTGSGEDTTLRRGRSALVAAAAREFSVLGKADSSTVILSHV